MNPRFIVHRQELRKEQSCSETCPTGEKPPALPTLTDPERIVELILQLHAHAKAQDAEERVHWVACITDQGETYVWFFGYDQRLEVMRSAGRMASDPNLNLTWYDCAKLGAEVRSLKQREAE